MISSEFLTGMLKGMTLAWMFGGPFGVLATGFIYLKDREPIVLATLITLVGGCLFANYIYVRVFE